MLGFNYFRFGFVTKLTVTSRSTAVRVRAAVQHRLWVGGSPSYTGILGSPPKERLRVEIKFTVSVRVRVGLCLRDAWNRFCKGVVHPMEGMAVDSTTRGTMVERGTQH